MICLDFLPRKVGGSKIMTLNLTCMFQPINKIHPGRVSGFQTHRRVKGIHPQLMFDAVKNGLLVRVTFDVPIDN